MTATNLSSLRCSGGGCIIDTVDEILSQDANAAGLAINWHCFGSNGQEKADYSRGVLERFTRRAHSEWFEPPTPNSLLIGNIHVKTIANPRKINFLDSPHFARYFEGYYAINEVNNVVTNFYSFPVTSQKIIVNHYYTKSFEEFKNRKRTIKTEDTVFNLYDRNDEFDDGILKYRDERAKTYQPPDKSHADERLFNALAKNLSPTILPNTPPEFYAGKMETFLTCRAVSSYLRTKLADDEPAKFFEEASLVAILKSLNGMTFADAQLLIRELPNLLSLPYPAVKELRGVALQLISQIMNTMRLNGMWKDFVELNYIHDLIKLGG